MADPKRKRSNSGSGSENNQNQKRKRSNSGSGSENNQNQPSAPTPDVVMVDHRFDCGHGKAEAIKYGIVIKTSTVKIVPSQNNLEKHHIEFIFDSHGDGLIRLYYSKFNGGHYDKDPGTIWKPKLGTKVKAGTDQKFVQGLGERERNCEGEGEGEGEGEVEVEFPSLKLGITDMYKLDIKAFPTGEDVGKNRICEITRVAIEMVNKKPHARVTNKIVDVNGVISVCLDFTDFRKSIYTTGSVPFEGCEICYSKQHPGMHKPIGKLSKTDIKIGNGSRKIVAVYHGHFGETPVAVKSIEKHGRDVVAEEIQIGYKSDSHANVVRIYTVEDTADYLLIALEKCECNLYKLLKSCDKYKPTRVGYTHLKLWNSEGHPLEKLRVLLRGICAGIDYSHKHGMTGLKLELQSILIDDGISFNAKVPNYMKRIASGWQKREILAENTPIHATDMYNFGVLLVRIIKYGYKEYRLIDDLIRKQRSLERLVKDIPEAYDLIYRLQHPNPSYRPTAAKAYIHPLFWKSETRMDFRQEASDELFKNKSKMLLAKLDASNDYIQWDVKLLPDRYVRDKLMKKMEKFGRYDRNSADSLLRFQRNCVHHPEVLTAHLKKVSGSAKPMGFDEYFSGLFPDLLMDVYNALKDHCVKEKALHKYYKHGEF